MPKSSWGNHRNVEPAPALYWRVAPPKSEAHRWAVPFLHGKLAATFPLAEIAIVLLLFQKERKEMAGHTASMFWRYAILVLIPLALGGLITLPSLLRAPQRSDVLDVLYYLFLLIPVVATMVAVRHAWHYLTRQ